jgi:uncharacterized OB-fold protein
MNTQEFVNLIASAGFRPKSYSGRGMFGKYCVSVNLDRDEETAFASAVINATQISDIRAVMRVISDHSKDSMGMGVVLYWRSMSADGVKFPDDSDDEEMD